MPNTYVDYIATQGQRNFSFNFPYLEVEHVKVYINNIGVSNFTVSTSSATEVVLGYDATAGDAVRIRRESDPATNLVDFENGSVLTESELDRGYLHNRYLAEEAYELRTGPTGAQGVPGDSGPPGPGGPSAYEVYQANGGTLNEVDWLATLVGPGSTVAGPPGPDGDSAYEVYLATAGPTPLSETQWLASLAGTPSTAPGPPGPSAYQSYVTTGGTLSETDWLASLEGPPGASIIGPAGLNWMGEWSSTVAYAIDDAVYEPNSGSSYIALSANTNSRPPNSNWTLLTAQGDDGPPGPEGDSAYDVFVANGGTLSETDWLASLVGPASTQPGPPGDSAYDIAFALDPNIGGQANWLASLVGPASTEPGPPGLSAYAVAQSTGFQGTELEWLESLNGADGNPSTQPGPPGPSAYQSYVNNVPSGEPVLPETDWLDTLVGPASTEPGPPGASAFAVAQSNGFLGNEQQWLESLVGQPGLESTVPGPPGQNVYDWALENNLFTGSEADFLASLQSTIPGPEGPSAYEVYESQFPGGAPLNEQGWLDSLVGPPGISAYESYVATTSEPNPLSEAEWAEGKSAYDSYLATTNDSPPKTEAEWVESLQGPPGPAGSASGAPTGTIVPWSGFEYNIPSGWLPCQGQTVFRHLFQDLWNLYKYAPLYDNELGISIGNAGGLANRGVWSSTTQYSESDVVFQYNNSIWQEYVATGSNIDSSPHLLLDWQRVYYKGIYNNLTTNHKNSEVFNVPDLRGRVIAGMDLNAGNISVSYIGAASEAHWYYNSNAANFNASATNTRALPGFTGGADDVLLTAAESGLPTHNHQINFRKSNDSKSDGNGSLLKDDPLGSASTYETGGTDAAEAHLNLPPTMLMTWIVKT